MRLGGCETGPTWGPTERWNGVQTGRSASDLSVRNYSHKALSVHLAKVDVGSSNLLSRSRKPAS
jgi:hypothetical protein